jgi:hypothetical protein
MIDDKHYIPILQGRQGEYGALRTMSDDVKQHLTPILEIPPIPWDHKFHRPAKTIDQHLSKIASTITKSWGPDRPVFVDLVWLESERMSDGSHPISYVFDAARKQGLQIVPTTGLGRGDGYQSACQDVHRCDHRGFCLRIQREDFGEPGGIEPLITTLLEVLGVGPREIDLVFDLRAVNFNEANVLATRVPQLINMVPQIQLWRSFTLAATGFPEDLIGLPPIADSFVTRIEWILWRGLFKSQITRYPTFGDYGIAHVQPSEVDPRIMRPSASIRYTTSESWLVVKGRNLRDYGFDQFHDVSRRLAARREYMGTDFSWGDWYINECANRRASSGNLTTWRKVGTSHHLAFVTRQIAIAAEPSVVPVRYPADRLS